MSTVGSRRPWCGLEQLIVNQAILYNQPYVITSCFPNTLQLDGVGPVACTVTCHLGHIIYVGDRHTVNVGVVGPLMPSLHNEEERNITVMQRLGITGCLLLSLSLFSPCWYLVLMLIMVMEDLPSLEVSSWHLWLLSTRQGQEAEEVVFFS